jgi:predicted acetyltransferase
VAPEARGRGLAGKLMRAALQEIAAEGVPLSGLYPATYPLYRRVGYEHAGHRFEYRLPVRGITGGDRSLAVRAVEEKDREPIRACYSAFASCFNGPLDRGDYIWSRVEKNRETVYYGFVAESPERGIEGYLYLSQTRKPERGRHDVAVSDLAFVSERAGRRLLAFFEDFSSMADEVVFYGGPLHPLCSLMAEQRYTLQLRDHWMIRIVDVAGAIAGRGFGCDRAEVHVDLADDVLPQNAGRWVLRVEDGVGSAERGGRGDLGMDIRALASVYSGLCSPEQLTALGRCSGHPTAVRRAAAMFAGTTPWMGDMY